MKKATKLIFAVILLFVVWIGIDRYMNITSYHSDGSTTIVEVSDGVWTNIPNGKWVQLDTKKFNALDSFLYVEDFNSITRTWKNVLGSDTTYSFKNERDIYTTVSIFERSIDFEHNFELDYESLQTEEVSGITVAYGKYNDNSYVVKYETNECEVIVITNKTYLDFLKPTLQEIYNQLQK